MAAEELVPWLRRSVRGFAVQQVAAGLSTEPEATAYAQRQLADLLPEGPDTPGHRIWTVALDDGPVVGSLWLQLRSGTAEAYVVDVEIEQPHRGRGLGRATMRAAESAARDLGATAISLNVFGHNTAALRLYEDLGYTVVTATFSTRPGRTPVPAPRRRVRLRDMGEQEYAAARSALDRAAGGRLDRLLPQGPATGGERLWVVLQEQGGVAGTAWMSLQHRRDGVHALVRHVEVRPELRRRGYGASSVVAVQRAAQELGVVTLTVEVGDVAAIDGAAATCAASGLDLTAQTMTKAL